MFDQLITDIRQLIERSVADIEQGWNYLVTVRYHISGKNAYIRYESEGKSKQVEIDQDEDE